MDAFPAAAIIGAVAALLFLAAIPLLRKFRAHADRLRSPPAVAFPLRENSASPGRVEDVMVPRSAITGIDLDDDWGAILEQLQDSRHAHLPLYVETVDNVIGVLHVRKLLALALRGTLAKERLRDLAEEAYFIPEATPLQAQLLAFQANRRRIGLVVDEYGDIRGLVTLEDILEEVAGGFATGPEPSRGVVTPEAGGTFLVNGNIPVRSLNRVLDWELPTGGPKTLNGLILEALETIPQPNTSVRIEGYPLEVVQTTPNAVKVVRVRPRDVRADREAELKTGEFTD